MRVTVRLKDKQVVKLFKLGMKFKITASEIIRKAIDNFKEVDVK